MPNEESYRPLWKRWWEADEASSPRVQPRHERPTAAWHRRTDCQGIRIWTIWDDIKTLESNIAAIPGHGCRACQTATMERDSRHQDINGLGFGGKREEDMSRLGRAYSL